MKQVMLLKVKRGGVKCSLNKEGTFWYKFYQSKPMFWIEISSLVAVYLCVLICI